MNLWVYRFLSGLGFLLLGAVGLVHRAGVVPPSSFRGHPLAAPEGGLPVEVVGWLGVLSGSLIAIGVLLIVRATHYGFSTGAIQAQVAAWAPKKKAAPEEADEEAEDD